MKNHPIELKGNVLYWNNDAVIKIYTLAGKQVFISEGYKGEKLQLKDRELKFFGRSDYQVQIFNKEPAK